MKSVMKHQFSQIPRADIPRSSFNRTHGHKSTFDAGYLIPFFIDDALPGDTFNLRHNIFARLATPIVPVMDNSFLDIHYFAVPYRLVWDNWQRFNGEQDDPGDTTDYLIPQIESPVGGWPVHSLSDYFGLPINKEHISVSSLFHRAYNLIWNEWYRDQNLQDSVPVPKGDGPDNDADFKLLKRNKRHDYFTACLPWPQKGPGVELPLGDKAPVLGLGMPAGTAIGTLGLNSYVQADGSYLNGFGSGITTVGVGYSAGGVASVVNPPDIYADLSQATAATINSLRQAFQIQKLYERDARGGSRYTEIIRSHFGVVSPDARLQRPEILGVSTARLHINPVMQTSSTDTESPQGNLAGYGIVADTGRGFTKSFTEHCLIIGLVSLRADLTYQQGIPRMFSRLTRFDHYWPALAHLGEQAVLNKEIYAQGSTVVNGQGEPVDEDVFGYQERWAEYRYFPSKITGKFRSTYAQPLDYWHLSQKFDNLPALNSEFIAEAPPFDRVIAVSDEPHILFDSHIELVCARPMPTYSVPGLTDHF